jgi:hypothetical protein
MLNVTNMAGGNRGLRTTVRDFLACLSLANLCFLHIWAQMPPYLANADLYMLAAPPQLAHYCVLGCNTILLACALTACFWLSRVSKTRAVEWCARLIIALFSVIALNSVRRVVYAHVPILVWRAWVRALGPVAAITFLGLCLVALATFAIGGRKWFCRAGQVVLFVMLPLVPLNLLAGAYASLQFSRARQWIDPPNQYQSAATAPSTSRVVLLLIDEWDYRLTFEARLPGLDLPELDRIWRHAAIRCALPAPSNRTLLSVPSILTAQQLEDVQVAGPSSILLQPVSSRLERLDMAGSIFSDAARVQKTSAVIGWYIPYCRVFRNALTQCSWSEASFLHFPFGPSRVENWARMWQSVISEEPLQQAAHARTSLSLQEQLLSVIREPSIDLVYAHLPVMHEPYFFDRKTHAFDHHESWPRGYWDSLALLDDLLARTTKALEDSGLAERTALILTSDHSLRTSRMIDGKTDPRVPVIVRAPWLKGPSITRTPATSSAAVVRPLVRRLLAGSTHVELN